MSKDEKLSVEKYLSRFRLSLADYEEKWHKTFRKVFRLPENPEAPLDEWPVLPERLFQDGYKLAFLRGNVLREQAPFKSLKRFFSECPYVYDSSFALLCIPSETQDWKRYAFPSDIDWEEYDQGASPEKEESTYWSPLTPSESARRLRRKRLAESVKPGNGKATKEHFPSAFTKDYHHYLVGEKQRWGMYYSKSSDVYMVGYDGFGILKGLQEAFGFGGFNLEVIEDIRRSGRGRTAIREVEEGRLFKQLEQQFYVEADWDPETLIGEEKYQQRYKLSLTRYESDWHEVLRTVFRVPEDVEASRGDWPVLPNRIFQEGYELAFLNGDLLREKEPFEQFKHFLWTRLDSEFVLVCVPEEVEEWKRFAFPIDISWERYCGSLPGVTRSSPTIFASNYYHYLVGRSGTWGMHYSEAFDVYVVGLKGEEVLKGLQMAFGFEGRNQEWIKDIKSGFNRHSREEARLFRQFAQRLQKEKPDSRADWDPGSVREPDDRTLSLQKSRGRTITGRAISPMYITIRSYKAESPILASLDGREILSRLIDHRVYNDWFFDPEENEDQHSVLRKTSPEGEERFHANFRLGALSVDSYCEISPTEFRAEAEDAYSEYAKDSDSDSLEMTHRRVGEFLSQLETEDFMVYKLLLEGNRREYEASWFISHVHEEYILIDPVENEIHFFIIGED